jgi:hypothetical protein
MQFHYGHLMLLSSSKDALKIVLNALSGAQCPDAPFLQELC